jgi:monothiol glutaredoxin
MENIVFDRIKTELEKDDVVLFMKGTPIFPQCGFSAAVAQIMGILGLTYHSIDVLQDSDIRQGIKDFTNWPTIAQLYIKQEFIGGCDIIREMYESGELQQMLDDKDITYNKAA